MKLKEDMEGEEGEGRNWRKKNWKSGDEKREEKVKIRRNDGI